VVVVQAPDHVAAVAPDVDVLGVRREHESIHRQVGLDEPAVLLRLECCELYLLGRDAQVEPGREPRDIDALLTIEDELSYDLLDPGRPRLGVGGDHHVIRPEAEFVPHGGV